jgi:hypothetical protein
MTVDAIGDELRALTVHDVSPAAAERTRNRCLAALSAHAATTARRRAARTTWLEPLAAIGVSLLYLVAAVRASMALLQ